MTWLTIDTSTSVLGIGVMNEETVWGEMMTDVKRHHSERLLPSIQQLLEVTHIPLPQIEGVAVTRGPGSYTGLRIGVTTAKILAWSRGIPLIGVSSLAALAVNGERFPGDVIPMWDARRGRVYTGHYQFDGRQQLVEVKEDRVINVRDWVDLLGPENGPFLFLGDGAIRNRQVIEAALGERAVFGALAENVIRPAAIGRLALDRYRKQGADDIQTFAPDYLQQTEAEANWDKRDRTGNDKN